MVQVGEVASQMTYLIFKRAGAEVAKGQFESTSAALEVDLEGHQSVGRARRWCGHDDGVLLLDSSVSQSSKPSLVGMPDKVEADGVGEESSDVSGGSDRYR